MYYVPAVLLKSTLAEFSSWLGLKLSKYIFMLKLLRTLCGYKSCCRGAASCKRKGWLCAGKRAAPDGANAPSNPVYCPRGISGVCAAWKLDEPCTH